MKRMTWMLLGTLALAACSSSSKAWDMAATAKTTSADIRAHERAAESHATAADDYEPSSLELRAARGRAHRCVDVPTGIDLRAHALEARERYQVDRWADCVKARDMAGETIVLIGPPRDTSAVRDALVLDGVGPERVVVSRVADERDDRVSIGLTYSQTIRAEEKSTEAAP